MSDSIALPVPVPKKRGRRRHDEGNALSRQQLIDGLLALAMREGEAGLNMRAIAAELDVSPRLLYYHVRDKNELFDLLGDAITAHCELPPPELPWRQRLLIIQRSLRDEILKYPGVPYRALVRSVQHFNSPHVSQRNLEIRKALAEAGLSTAQVEQAFAALHVYFMGNLVLADAQRNTDINSGAGTGANLPDLDANFEQGLNFLLTGIESLRSHGFNFE